MAYSIINGKELSQKIQEEIKEKIACLKTCPHLAVILIGDNPASQTYVKNKEKACQNVGIKSITYHLDKDIKQQELEDFIIELNNDKQINGILVQLPLPKHLETEKILSLISPLKDVDGFHPLNTGLLVKGSENAILPCTPKGIIKMLHSVKEDLSGLNAVVIGRSQIVGLPIAQLLIKENCTTTVTHSHTKDLSAITQNADILVVAIGKPDFINKEHIKKGAIVIDVGINKTDNGLKGDVDFDSAKTQASYITPVPGGVGPMTIAMLLENTYLAYLNQTTP